MTWEGDPAKGCGLMLLLLFVIAVFAAGFLLAWLAGVFL